MNLTQPLHKALIECPQAEALACAGRRWTWAAFTDRVARLAAVLQQLGLQPGDRVGMLGMNSDHCVVFFHAARRRYAAVVAMYHDQGLAPLKMAAFDRGVNVTLGLPIVRTCPDHGVAYDIAGQGRADPGSMREAIRLAARLARRPNPWLRFRRRP